MKRQLARGLFTRLVASVAALLTQAAVATEPMKSSGGSIREIRIDSVRYPTIETQYVVHNMPLSSEIKWIDDDRVIFSGYEEGLEGILPSGNRGLKQGVYIFSAKARKAVRHADGELKCFGGDRIRYVVQSYDPNDPRGRFTTHAGVLGAEKEIPNVRDMDSVENKFSCNLYERAKVPLVAGLPAYLLFEEHGYLELTFWVSTTLNEPVRFLRAGGVPTELPVKQAGMRSPKISWFPHAGQYLIYDRNPSEVNDRSDPAKPRRVGIPKRLVALSPKGSFEVIEVPYHAWHRGLGRFYLTKLGLLMISRGRDSRATSYRQEVFLIRGTQWESILEAAEVTDAAVSADGCKVANGVADAQGSRPLLRIVDLCSQGGRK